MRYLGGFIFALGAVLALGVSIMRSSSVPDRVPMHWNLAGQVDRYGGRFEALYFLPIMLGFMALVFGFIGLIAGRRLGPNTVKALNIISTAIATFLVVLHNSLLSGSHTSVPGMLPIYLPGLLIVIGFAIRGVEPNPFVGIRVSWTMNNPSVWRKTHDRASKLWIWGGVVGVLMAIFGAPIWVPISIFTVCILYPLLDSYMISQSLS